MHPYDEIKPLAEGKLQCECGNDDWTKFLYVGAASVWIAGCKECGCRTYKFKDGVWKKI